MTYSAPESGRFATFTRGWRTDRGSAALELVVMFPALVALMFGLVQGAVFYHARSVASAAAMEGLIVARSETGTTAAASSAATQFVSQAGGESVLSGASVQVSRSTTDAAVTVTGSAPVVLVGLFPLVVSQTATAPVERFTS